MLKSKTLKSRNKSKIPCQNKNAISRWRHPIPIKLILPLTTLTSMMSSYALLYTTVVGTDFTLFCTRADTTLCSIRAATGRPSTDVSSEVSLRHSFPRCSGARSPRSPHLLHQERLHGARREGETRGQGGHDGRGQEGIDGLRNYPISSRVSF